METILSYADPALDLWEDDLTNCPSSIALTIKKSRIHSHSISNQSRYCLSKTIVLFTFN